MHNAKLIKSSLTSGCNYTSIRHFFQNDIRKNTKKKHKKYKKQIIVYALLYTHNLLYN